MAVKPIPDGYSTVTPYLIVDDAAGALEYYKNAFGGVEIMRMDWGEGMIGHAEMMIGDSRIMLASEFPSMGAVGPKTVGGTPVMLAVYVEDVDAVFAKALELGGTEVRPLENQFYGDRSGMVCDPFGHHWSLSTHVEDVPPDELARRSEAMRQGGMG